MLNKLYIKAEQQTVPVIVETDYHYAISKNSTTLAASEINKGFPGILMLNTDGTIDTSFKAIKSGGFYTTTTLQTPKCATIQSDGKIILGGGFSTFNGVTRSRIVRLNSDGSLDTSFQVGTGFSGENVFCLAVQPDDKILAGGSFVSYNGTTRNQIIRLNSNGTVDTSFVVGTGFDTYLQSPQTIALQADGKVVVGGDFITYNGISNVRIVRLNSDGSLDTSFVTGSGFNTSVFNIQIQSDGKILIGGSFTSYNGTARNRIVRLNSDGSIDTSFAIGTGFNNPVSIISIQSDGKILMGGSFTSYNGTATGCIIRLNSDGSIDTSFAIGTGFNSSVSSLTILPDGTISAVGGFTSYNGVPISNFVCRLNSDGSINTTFNVTAERGIQTSSFSSLSCLAIASGTKILVYGFFQGFKNRFYQASPGFATANLSARDNFIVKYDPAGSIKYDNFTGVVLSSAFINLIKVQNDGKIIFIGSANYDGLTANIARLNSDGSLDVNFPNGIIGTNGIFDNSINAIAIQADGKILMGGAFTSYFGVTRNRIIRLNSDGNEDPSFSIGSGFSGGGVFNIQIQSDGKILVCGDFTSYNGIARNRIIRLNSDGSIDTSFTIGGGFGTGPRIIVIQPDGKILIGGSFSSYNGVTRNRIVRLNSDGSEDTSFLMGTGFNADTLSISLQSDGKILIGGSFTSYNGTAVNRIVRLNSDGTVDTSFAIGTGFDNRVNSVAVQSTGKILVSGLFTTYNGEIANRLTRLNADGTLDSSYSALLMSQAADVVLYKIE